MNPAVEGTAVPTVIGIDIGKEIFHLVGFSAEGKLAFRKKIKRLALADIILFNCRHLGRALNAMRAR